MRIEGKCFVTAVIIARTANKNICSENKKILMNFRILHF